MHFIICNYVPKCIHINNFVLFHFVAPPLLPSPSPASATDRPLIPHSLLPGSRSSQFSQCWPPSAASRRWYFSTTSLTTTTRRGAACATPRLFPGAGSACTTCWISCSALSTWAKCRCEAASAVSGRGGVDWLYVCVLLGDRCLRFVCRYSETNDVKLFKKICLWYILYSVKVVTLKCTIVF